MGRQQAVSEPSGQEVWHSDTRWNLCLRRARVSLTLRLICGYLLRSLLPFLTCIYDTLLDLEIYRSNILISSCAPRPACFASGRSPQRPAAPAQRMRPRRPAAAGSGRCDSRRSPGRAPPPAAGRARRGRVITAGYRSARGGQSQATHCFSTFRVKMREREITFSTRLAERWAEEEGEKGLRRG